jgi:hypothetical protein
MNGLLGDKNIELFENQNVFFNLVKKNRENSQLMCINYRKTEKCDNVFYLTLLVFFLLSYKKKLKDNNNKTH